MHSSQSVVRTQVLPQLVDISTPIPLVRRFSEGDVLGGKYRLDRLVGEGAMGEVWLGENVLLELPVALKLLRREAFRDGGALGGAQDALADRLIVEARTTAKLVHPGIVRILDFGTDRGYPFLVLERLEGEDLRERLTREGALGQLEAVRLILPVIDAVHFAHGHGIVHRDLKPENVFLAVDHAGGIEPKVLDFGVASLSLRATDANGGFVAGTLPYMAPEHLQGRADADHRVDVYSITVMLLELITGRRPLQPANALRPSADDAFFLPRELGAIDVLWQADPRVLAPKLANILARGLAASPHDRWASMRVFGQALAEWLLERGVEDDVLGRSLRSHWLDDAQDVVFPVEVAEAPTPVRRAVAFVDDPIVLPKKRSWAGLGAVGAILIAGALSTAVAFDVTSLGAIRERLGLTDQVRLADEIPVPIGADVEEEAVVPAPMLALAAPAPAAINVVDLPDAAAPGPEASAASATATQEASPAKRPVARKAFVRRATRAPRVDPPPVERTATAAPEWGLEEADPVGSNPYVEPAPPPPEKPQEYMPDGL
jgi:serine/threonine-protein kinase